MEFFVTLTVLGLVFFMSHAAPLSKMSSEENAQFGDFFEGDMMLSEAQRAMIENAIKDGGKVESRNGLVFLSARWPSKTVVYRIKNGAFDNEQTQKIRDAMSDIEKQSCIKFRETKSNEHAVTIQADTKGCYSNVGYQGRSKKKIQILNLGNGCFPHGTIIHEMLHVLGFVHMQSTYDRDDYVTIVWKNIQKDKDHNFSKFTRSTVTDFGVPYDYGSVMHYPRKAFSKNGEDTIVPKKATNAQLGQKVGLSASDVLKLKKMYNC